MRRASTFARQSICSVQKKPCSPSEYIKVRRSSIELQILQLQLELDLLDSMTEMSVDDKLQTTFSLIDIDDDKKIDVDELGDGLRTIQGELDSSFGDTLRDSVKTVVSYDKNGDGQLDMEEFKEFIDNLAKKSSSTFEETLEMSMFALFLDNAERPKIPSSVKSRSILKVIAKEEQEENEKLRTNTRMRILFDVFDVDGDSNIDFTEFVLGIYKVTDSMSGTSKAAMEAMLMFDQDDIRSLSFEGFVKVIINLCEASADGMDLDDVLDVMTSSIILSRDKSSEDVMRDLTADITLNQISQLGRISELNYDTFQESSNTTLGALEYAKIYRLHKLWDLDGDNLIDFEELLLGLRKFQAQIDVVCSVDDACAIFNMFDDDGNQELDFSEFASFIEEYGKQNGADIHELLDCMIVTTALNKNTAEDVEFLRLIEIKQKELETQ